MCQYRHVAGLKHEMFAHCRVRNVQLTIQEGLGFEYSSQELHLLEFQMRVLLLCDPFFLISEHNS